MCAIRILIVEDDPDVSELLLATLDPPYECMRAMNGLEGWQMALEGQPDLILSDIMMPVMDGREFILRLRAAPEFAKMPVIFLTALGSRDDIKKGYELGAALYLTKPIDPERLLRNIELFIKDHGIAARPKQREVRDVEREVTGPPAKLKAAASGGGGDRPAPKQAAASSAETSRRMVIQPDPALPREMRQADQKTEKPRILLAEDDPDAQAMIRDGLAAEYEVIVASNGLEAIERAARYRPDIFVLDGMLPKVTGYQLIGMFRKNRRFHATPIVFISGRASVRDKQYVEKLGVKTFLPKPFDIAQLESALREIRADPAFLIRPKTISQRQAALEAQRDFDAARGNA